MAKQVHIGKATIVVGISKRSFGLGFNISRFGIDLTLLVLWITLEF